MGHEIENGCPELWEYLKPKLEAGHRKGFFETFSGPLRFPSLALVSIFSSIDLIEQKPLHEWREEKGYDWHEYSGNVRTILSPIS